MTIPDELSALLGELEVDSLLITTPANVRYLTGFTTPKDGRVLITPKGAWLSTDGRYDVQAKEESRLEVDLRRDWIPWVANQMTGKRLGVEADDLSLALYRALEKQLPEKPIELSGILRSRRMIKRPPELDLLRRAARITDEAFEHILGFIKAGVAEVEVALELERFMRSRGADGVSFDTVVASGRRSAMPHGVASRKVIEDGELVTLDFGALVEGYHADMTRTVAVGEVGAQLRKVYEAVLEAEEAALAATAPGVTGKELDTLARRILANYDLEEYFAHSLGHGVGLDIHEGPTLSQTSQDVLEPGMAITIEPGAYLPGRGGVRIEDLVIVTGEGGERLSNSPKELIVLN